MALVSEPMLLWRKAAECGAVTVFYWNKRPLGQRELPFYAPTKLPEWPEMYHCAEKARFFDKCLPFACGWLRDASTALAEGRVSVVGVGIHKNHLPFEASTYRISMIRKGDGVRLNRPTTD